MEEVIKGGIVMAVQHNKKEVLSSLAAEAKEIIAKAAYIEPLLVRGNLAFFVRDWESTREEIIKIFLGKGIVFTKKWADTCLRYYLKKVRIRYDILSWDADVAYLMGDGLMPTSASSDYGSPYLCSAYRLDEWGDPLIYGKLVEYSNPPKKRIEVRDVLNKYHAW